MSSIQVLLVFIIAMLAASALGIVLLGYLLGLYDKYRARKHAAGQSGDAPQPAP
ncbi:MAG: hypothetical protein OXU71_02680 [Gammaproteobacteria bacterium]|nr:hypothetical protein [Gammaproteobacteria bacterium]